MHGISGVPRNPGWRARGGQIGDDQIKKKKKNFRGAISNEWIQYISYTKLY